MNTSATDTVLETILHDLHTRPYTSATLSDEKEKSRPTVTIETVSETLDEIQIIPPNVLPPKDKGRAAITMLIACLVLDSTTYGLLLSYGVFQEYYTSHFPNHTKASWIGVLSNGVVFLGAPAVAFCCQRFTLGRKYYIWIGFALCFLSLLCSAFITSLPGLIVMQGLCYGIGALLTATPELIILNTWFDKRRGLAYGIVFGGSDLFGAGYTYLITELLYTLGHRRTFLVLASILFLFAGSAILVLQERSSIILTVDSKGRRRSSTISSSSILPSAKVVPSDLPFSPSIERAKSWSVRQPDKRYFQRGAFYILILCNFLQACAVYLPFIYLPVFAVQLGHGKETAALILAIGNIGMLVGDLAFGQLSDKVDVNILVFVSSGVSAVATFVLWGLFGSGSSSRGVLTAFALLFGIFGGGFVVLWARMGTLFGERDAVTVYSAMSFGRGVGGILSGPFSQILISRVAPAALKGFNDTKFGGLIVFVGSCMIASALLGIVAMGTLWWKKEEGIHAEAGLET